MSPTKPKPAATGSRVLTRAASSIPRRATTTTKTTRSKTTSTAPSKTVLKPKAPTTRRKQDSVLNNPTNAGTSTNIFSAAARNNALSDDKENVGAGSTRVLRSRFRAASPTKGKTGVCKTSPTKATTTRTRSTRRVPLRELTDHEIFERDAAALGDLRRRRSGEHSGTYVEFETHHAPDAEPSGAMEMREGSIISSTTEATLTTVQTDITEPAPLPYPAKEKIQVLRRTSSVESLQRKVEAIMAATASTNNTKATTKKRIPQLRNRPLSTPQKLQHPAVRSGSPGLETPDPLAYSPILAPRAQSPISKASPSPPRPVRIGLGAKNVNTLLKEVTKAMKNDAVTGKKPILSASNAPATKTTIAKKAGFNSLRRAAGTSTRLRPTPSTTALSSTRTGLDALRRMR